MHRLRQTEAVDGRQRVFEAVAHELGDLVDEKELRRFGDQFALSNEFIGVRVDDGIAVAVGVEADVEFGVAQRSDRLRRLSDDLLRRRF